MKLRWTPDVVERVRAMAADGLCIAQVARAVGATSGATFKAASREGISFHGKRYQQRESRKDEPRPPVLSWMSPEDQMRAMARQDLDQQIALARAEAPTAPLYRGGWP